MDKNEHELRRPLKAKGRFVPLLVSIVGGAGVIAAGILDSKQLGFSWLVAFMFFLSICLGALFLVLIHHLCDAAWSVPIRRFCEHLACLIFPVGFVLFLPLAALAPKIYPWMGSPQARTQTWWFYTISAICLAASGLIARRLRHWSLRQDSSGASECTFKMRRYSILGIFVFAATVTCAAVGWIGSITPGWTSTMYGVWYLAASLWVGYATIYAMTAVLARTGHLSTVLRDEQFYFLATLLLAFTVFYAYIAYSQYFVIWNGNLPEETFWYTLRDHGSWRIVGLGLVFGHFFIPFLLLLRIDWKLKIVMMLPLCAGAWLMHFADLQFQIMPSLHPEGPRNLWVDLSCLLLMGGVLAECFLRSLSAHAAYPQHDPRLAEALGIDAPATTDIATAPERAK